jgi:hypothetical protein
VHCGYAGAAACYDNPTARVELRSRWEQYVVPFRSFSQKGFGLPIADFYRARGLAQNASVAFGLPRNVTFDFWIAAFGYYRAKDYAPF